MCVILIKRLLRLVGRWAREPVNHTSWVAVVTPTDRPKSVRNRCLIELFCGVVCVVTLPFWHFCWCKGFCHRTESDLFLFLLLLKKQTSNYDESYFFLCRVYLVACRFFEKLTKHTNDKMKFQFAVFATCTIRQNGHMNFCMLFHRLFVFAPWPTQQHEQTPWLYLASIEMPINLIQSDFKMLYPSLEKSLFVFLLWNQNNDKVSSMTAKILGSY